MRTNLRKYLRDLSFEGTILYSTLEVKRLLTVVPKEDAVNLHGNEEPVDGKDTIITFNPSTW